MIHTSSMIDSFQPFHSNLNRSRISYVLSCSVAVKQNYIFNLTNIEWSLWALVTSVLEYAALFLICGCPQNVSGTKDLQLMIRAGLLGVRLLVSIAHEDPHCYWPIFISQPRVSKNSVVWCSGYTVCDCMMSPCNINAAFFVQLCAAWQGFS